MKYKMDIEFEKWHACYNNFILVWSSKNNAKYLLGSLQRQASKLCSTSGDGVSADGNLFLTVENYSDTIPTELVIINRDGSLAKNCGNGLRCAASSVYRRIQKYEKEYDLPEFLELTVEKHTFICQYLEYKNTQKLPYTVIDMGNAILDEENSWHENALVEVKKIFLDLKEEISDDDISTCYLQNKHIVVLHEKANFSMLEALGSRLQKSSNWDGINVHLACEISYENLSDLEKQKIKHNTPKEFYQIWIWERGVGPTKACGSGACSVGAKILSTGLSPRDEWLGIKSSGGVVMVKQGSANLGVQLQGDAELVFTGKIDI